MTRLIVNVSQVYLAYFVTETLKLHKVTSPFNNHINIKCVSNNVLYLKIIYTVDIYIKCDITILLRGQFVCNRAAEKTFFVGIKNFENNTFLETYLKAYRWFWNNSTHVATALTLRRQDTDMSIIFIKMLSSNQCPTRQWVWLRPGPGDKWRLILLLQ